VPCAKRNAGTISCFNPLGTGNSRIRKEPEKYADLLTTVGTDFAYRTVEEQLIAPISPWPAFWNNGRLSTVDRRRLTAALKALLHQLLRINIDRHDDFLGECQFVQDRANRVAETADCVGPHEYLVSIIAL
jgi:hypothetical protein